MATTSTPLHALALRCCKIADAIEGYSDHFETADVEIRAAIHNDGLVWYEARLGRYCTDTVLSLDGALLALEQELKRKAADLALDL